MLVKCFLFASSFAFAKVSGFGTRGGGIILTVELDDGVDVRGDKFFTFVSMLRFLVSDVEDDIILLVFRHFDLLIYCLVEP